MGVSVVFETHSISVDNEQGIATGWLDGTLSEAGVAQARQLGERRRNPEELVDAPFDWREGWEYVMPDLPA